MNEQTKNWMNEWTNERPGMEQMNEWMNISSVQKMKFCHLKEVLISSTYYRYLFLPTNLHFLLNFVFQIREYKWEDWKQFFSFVELNKPNIIVGTETWLTKEMFDSEFFPPELGFAVYRRDRIGQKGGGVIILVRSALSSEEKSEFNSDCENLWVQLNLVGSKSVLIGAYYKPHEFDQHSLAGLQKTDFLPVQTDF